MKIDANEDSYGTKQLDLDGTSINLLADAAVTGDLAVSGDLAVAGEVALGALDDVADPGDGNTITPPTNGGNFKCEITTAGAETRVLGTPARLGQRAIVVFDTDGGDFTMSNAVGWLGKVSSVLATFSAEGNAVLFEAVGTSAATEWRAVAAAGVTFGSSLGEGWAAVADPGDAGTIAPPADGADFACTVDTTTGSETRVMGTPTRVGQLAHILYGTDGGDDFAMSNASGWQDGPNTEATFDTSGDAAILVALGTGAATDWRVLRKKGVVLST